MKREVKFSSPGTFIAEQSTQEIEGKNKKDIIKKAMVAASTIVERHNSIPFCFHIKGDNNTYYLPHCKKILLKDIPKTKENAILISNCESNGWSAVIQTTKGWKYTLPFTKDCILLGDEEYDVASSIMELI